MSRIRIIAGPNGSGKSSVFDIIKSYRDEQNRAISTGPFVNADVIEKSLRENGFIDLKDYGIDTFSTSLITDYVSVSTIKGKYDASVLADMTRLENTILRINRSGLDLITFSLLGMIVADLLREHLLKIDVGFTTETVFSHESKIAFIRKAAESGSRVYLYFVSTESPDLNIQRISGRVAAGGHSVPPDKVRERYVRTMQNLKPALAYCYRAYIFDNSTDKTQLIAEMSTEKIISVHHDSVPEWFYRYVMQ